MRAAADASGERAGVGDEVSDGLAGRTRDLAAVHQAVLTWYDEHRRDLPWRRAECSPWGVFVSEVMLQQTPVARVEPVWRDWMTRWPTPGHLAADSPGEAVRRWDRLGYPRRALRVHQAATAMVERHGGAVPSSQHDLLALPGVGAYTAAAVAAFAFGARATVVDTNVRRVLGRLLTGVALPAPALTRAETTLAAAALPPGDPEAARWNVALMELGALVCTARSPRCDACPVREVCAWRLAGSPAYAGPPRRGQAWAGTDRQARGALLAVLRDATGPVDGVALASAWPTDDAQRERALTGLLTDGLLIDAGDGRYALPQ